MTTRAVKIPSLRVPVIDSSGTWPVGQRREVVRALLADDDPQLLRVLARVLRRAGMEVETAATVQEALDLVSALGFDVIITDLFSPCLAGARILAAVREFDRLLPVVVITGDSSMSASLNALEDPALHVLPKPFSNEAFCELVRELAVRDLAVCR
jgi:DNA-binding NtrC family response regulator